MCVLQISARDQDSKWLTALALLDDDTFIAADNGHNLVRVFVRNSWMRSQHAGSLPIRFTSRRLCDQGSYSMALKRRLCALLGIAVGICSKGGSNC